MLISVSRVRHQGAVIPYTYENDQLLITLIKSKHKGNWGIPKGKIEKNTTAKESAATEALEEAGLLGTITHTLGSYKYVKGSTGVKQNVQVFGFEVSKQKKKYMEVEWRIRKTFTLKEAMSKLNKQQRVFLKKLAKQLG